MAAEGNRDLGFRPLLQVVRAIRPLDDAVPGVRPHRAAPFAGLDRKNTLVARYQEVRARLDNQGAGDFNLSSRSYGERQTERVVQITGSAGELVETRFFVDLDALVIEHMGRKDEVGEVIENRTAFVDLHTPQFMRTASREQIRTGIDRGSGE